MHIVFVHQNFPAQFGQIASYLVRKHGCRCTFVSEQPAGIIDGIEKIHYRIEGGATAHTHYCSRSYENAIWHSHAVYNALKARPDIRPDVVVGHSGFLTTVFLRELYDCAFINYFEYYYLTRGSDMDFRPDFPYPEINMLRARARNAVLLLDLENCDRGYSPTHWQRSRFPTVFHDKIHVIFDGIDTSFWQSLQGVSLGVQGRILSPETRLVTYVARGMESLRGFDVFMKFAKRLYERRQDVVFLVVGSDRICYGGDADFTGKQSFKEWVLAQDQYDLSRIIFAGQLSPLDLAKLLSISNLHVYLSVPFVLSWSLLNALACETTVLAADTAPVREVIEDGKNGLLVDFFDLDRMVELAMRVLDAPRDYKHLGKSGRELVRSRYSLEVCLPQMLDLYHEAMRGRRTEPMRG